jgi:hypothetical protein
MADDIECVRTMRGDNNRRHQFLQQALFNILKSVGLDDMPAPSGPRLLWQRHARFRIPEPCHFK